MKDNQYYKAYKKVRKTWNIRPVEKVVTSKKEYDRNEAKQHVRLVVDEELEAYDDYEWFNDPIDNNI
jgi:hypothetical protein